MQNLSDHYGVDKFAGHLGIELVEVALGTAKAKMEIKEHHLNGLGILHGGALFTLADFVFGIACNTHHVEVVAVNANISFLKAVSKGVLYAEAEEVSITAKMGTYLATVKDETGEVIAVFQGLGYRKQSRK